MTIPLTEPAARRRLRSRLLVTGSVLDVPELAERVIDPEILLAVSGASRLGDLRSRDVEALPFPRSEDETRAASVIGAALRGALERRTRLGVGLIDEGQVSGLRMMLGDEQLHQIGPAGPDGRVPVAVNPRELAAAWCVRTRAYLQAMRDNLAGIDALHLPGRLLRALREAGVPVRERPSLVRLLRNPVVVAYLVVLVYSALRALPVTFVPGFHGHVAILWGIDLLTAIPYTWGIIAMVAGRRLWIRGLGLLTAVVTFVAPYVYFWTHGHGYPWFVDLVIAVMILSAVGLEGVRWARDAAVAAGLRRR